MELKTGYKQTEVGVIPSDWEVKEIGNEIDLLTGFPFPSSKYSIVGIRLLRGSNIKRGVTDWAEEITQYWDKITPALKEYVLQEKDIVIAMDGSLVGRSFAQLSSNDLPALLLQRVARVRSKKIDIGYLKEFICSEYFTKHCDAVKTSSAIPHISPLDIRKFKIPIPPTLAEQTAIATTLSDTDQYITHLEKLIAKKRNIKQGAMQELLRAKEGWVVKKLGDALKIRHGKSQKEVTDSNGEFPILASGGVIGQANTFLYDKPSVLIGRKGTIDKPQFMDNPFWTVDTLFYTEIFKEFDAKFVFYMFNLIDWYAYNEASGVPSLNAKTIENIERPFPKTKSEQTRIATILSDMDSEITTLETKLSKAKSIKQGMMQQLLTGKIRLI